MSSEDSKSTRNTTITVALIGAGATVLAALIGLIASKGGSQGTSAGGSPTASTSVSAPASTPASAPATGGDTASPASIAPGPSGSVAVVWRHNVRFPSETGLDLRDNQPNIVQMVSIPDFETAGTDFPGFIPDGSRAAGTVPKANPTFSDCINSFISQSQTSTFEVQVGQSACFQSRDGTRVAAVTVLFWDRQSSSMNADVTVWRTPGSG